MSEKLSHIDSDGQPNMVNVQEKKVTKRTARARSIVVVGNSIMEHLKKNRLHTKKGSVFQTAIIAGIMGAKKTGDLIPLCHPIGLENCAIDIYVNESNEIIIDCEATVTSKTGVEMEALTGASIAALTVYDMCKAMSHDIKIKEIKLMSKTGGKKDYFRNE